jgi:hypothetical protein
MSSESLPVPGQLFAVDIYSWDSRSIIRSHSVRTLANVINYPSVQTFAIHALLATLDSLSGLLRVSV